MGHNGSARTYMLLKRLYYWKGMKTDINIYVKQCKLCQKQNIVPVKYSQGHFSAPMAPMEFISMDLIGDFVPSSKGNKYALTVIKAVLAVGISPYFYRFSIEKQLF